MTDDFDREDVQGAFVKMQKLACHLHTWRSCINCVNFHDDGDPNKPNFCTFASRNIPAKVFAVGCKAWISRDEIPF